MHPTFDPLTQTGSRGLASAFIGAPLTQHDQPERSASALTPKPERRGGLPRFASRSRAEVALEREVKSIAQHLGACRQDRKFWLASMAAEAQAFARGRTITVLVGGVAFGWAALSLF